MVAQTVSNHHSRSFTASNLRGQVTPSLYGRRSRIGKIFNSPDIAIASPSCESFSLPAKQSDTLFSPSVHPPPDPGISVLLRIKRPFDRLTARCFRSRFPVPDSSAIEDPPLSSHAGDFLADPSLRVSGDRRCRAEPFKTFLDCSRG